MKSKPSIRAGQGEVPAGRPGGAHPPVGAQQAPGQQRNGSSIVTKVLYVEDNDDNVFMLKMRLELLGDFEVLTAEDGEKGCAMAISESPGCDRAGVALRLSFLASVLGKRAR
jgi:hypothetical protein